MKCNKCKYLCYLALIVLVINSFSYMLRPTNMDPAVTQIQAFHDIEKNSIDVMVYGSSHIWYDLDTKLMQDKYGISAYNYGCFWQHFNTTELFFNDSLNYQKPKVAIIETYKVNELVNDAEMDGEIYYTRKIPFLNSKKADYLYNCFGNNISRYISYFLPLISFHSNWEFVKLVNFQSEYNKDVFIDNRGFFRRSEGDNKKVKLNLPKEDDSLQEDLDDASVSVLDNIVRACEDNSIEVLFVSSPNAAYYPYAKAMEKYAEENGCIYLNLFNYVDEIDLDLENDFYDKGHMNNYGAAKMADFLSRYVLEHYDLSR